MRLFVHAPLYLPLLAQVSDARQPAAVPKDSPGLCVTSCEASLKSLRFADVNATASTLIQACRSRLALSSKYVCLGLNCGTKTRDSAIQHHNATCYNSFGSPVPAFKTDYTDDEVAGLKEVSKDDSFGSDNPLAEVVVPSPQWFKAWFDTLDAVEYAHRLHHLYGFGVMVFWAAVVFVGLGNKTYLAVSQMYCSHHSFDSVGIRTDTGSWFKRNVTIPATFGYRCAQNVWLATIPPRIQTLTITVFLLMNIGFCIHGYRIIDDSLYFGTPTKQVLRYVADRTGIISFANFPLIWLFGMRNNVAIWLTGWDFGTYNNFHRWCARISTLEAVVHSILYTILIFKNGGWNYYAWWFTMWFWNAGQIATISMCALLVFSVYWIRRRCYEAFLVIHIGLSILILFTMLGHVSIFDGEYDALFWIPAFIWAFDRAMRLLRVIVYNPGRWSTTALASYSQSANIIRLSIPVDKALYTPRPGNYFYLTVLDDKRFWESHPFTIASLSGDLPQKAEFSDENEGVPLLASATNPPEAGVDRIDVEPQKHHMTFLIRPYDGLSGRLRDVLADEQVPPAPIRVLVDGPYGHTQRLHQYQRVLFIAGGSGVVVALSYLNTLCHETKSLSTVELHWAVREPRFARDVLAKEAKKAITTGRLSVHLYMSPHMDIFDMGELPSQVEQHVGRPNIHSIVMSVARGAQGGNLAVVACGPARMADDSRLAVVDALREGNHHIDYYEESFTW
ncbi:ferric reductase like transmembrane component domain-containing protein [Trichoderma novae-zelandiae]